MCAMYNKRNILYLMKLFSTISAVTHMIFRGYMHSTSTESVSVHTRPKREAYTLSPTLYESRRPLVQCFDVSAEEQTIHDEELQEYDDLHADIDIHNVPFNQSLVLYDTLCIDRKNLMGLVYVGRSRSKDIVYNTHAIHARQLNSQKFNDNYRHKKSTKHMYNKSSYAHIDNDMSFLVSSLFDIPVDMRLIAEGAIGHMTSKQKSVADVYEQLQNASFVFNIDDHEVIVHNVDTIFFDTLRILQGRDVCGMCMSVSFENKDYSGSIEYINVYNHMNYTRPIEHSVRSYYYPSVQYDGLFNVMRSVCDTQTMRVHEHHRNIDVILALSISAGIAIGIIVSALLFKPIAYCVRKFYGVTPLTAQDNNALQEVKLLAV